MLPVPMPPTPMQPMVILLLGAVWLSPQTPEASGMGTPIAPTAIPARLSNARRWKLRFIFLSPDSRGGIIGGPIARARRRQRHRARLRPRHRFCASTSGRTSPQRFPSPSMALPMLLCRAAVASDVAGSSKNLVEQVTSAWQAGVAGKNIRNRGKEGDRGRKGGGPSRDSSGAGFVDSCFPLFPFSASTSLC